MLEKDTRFIVKIAEDFLLPLSLSLRTSSWMLLRNLQLKFLLGSSVSGENQSEIASGEEEIKQPGHRYTNSSIVIGIETSLWARLSLRRDVRPVGQSVIIY